MELKLLNYATTDYYHWIKSNSDLKIKRTTYSAIINYGNALIAERLLKGENFKMNGGLGVFRILRCNRDFSKTTKNINIVKTMEARKEDPEAFVYYNDAYYYYLKLYRATKTSLFYSSFKFSPNKSFTKALWYIIQNNDPALKKIAANNYIRKPLKGTVYTTSKKFRLLWQPQTS